MVLSAQGQIPRADRQIRRCLPGMIPRALLHGTKYSHLRGAQRPKNDYPSALAPFKAKHGEKHPHEFDCCKCHVGGSHPAEPTHMAPSLGERLWRQNPRPVLLVQLFGPALLMLERNRFPTSPRRTDRHMSLAFLTASSRSPKSAGPGPERGDFDPAQRTGGFYCLKRILKPGTLFDNP